MQYPARNPHQTIGCGYNSYVNNRKYEEKYLFGVIPFGFIATVLCSAFTEKPDSMLNIITQN